MTTTTVPPIDLPSVSRALERAARVFKAVPSTVAALQEAVDFLPLHSEARKRTLNALAEILEAMS